MTLHRRLSLERSSRKLEKVITHGPPVVSGLLCTVGPYSVRVRACSKVAVIAPWPVLAGMAECTRF